MIASASASDFVVPETPFRAGGILASKIIATVCRSGIYNLSLYEPPGFHTGKNGLSRKRCQMAHKIN